MHYIIERMRFTTGGERATAVEFQNNKLYVYTVRFYVHDDKYKLYSCTNKQCWVKKQKKKENKT